MDEHYAESVAIGGLREDVELAFSVRLGRFPHQGTGTLWLSCYLDGNHFAVTESDLRLATVEATRVAEEEATFEVGGVSTARFESRGRHTRAMRGTASASSLAHESSDPAPGKGTIPMRVDASFEVGHAPVQVRPGRMEVMGRVKGMLVVGDQAHAFDMPGKWHEQVGPRPSFAPAFTYLFVQGEGVGIMATKHARRAWGYMLESGETIALTAMEIDPYGSSARTFTVQLEGGRSVTGVARVQRETSVPIEGKRRPGATVIVESDVGRMVGELNDWNPDR